MVHPTDPTQPLEPDLSLGELLGRVTSDFGNLVSTQVELAKVEIKEEVAKAGKGAAMISGGAVAALLGVLLVSMAAAWGLAEVIEPGWSFLIVGTIAGWPTFAPAGIRIRRSVTATTCGSGLSRNLLDGSHQNSLTRRLSSA